MPLSCFKRCQSPEVKTLKEIDLTNSALHDVPTSIFLHERTLDTLLLNSNRIQDLPLPLFYCQNLQILNLSDNDIATIPRAIGMLVNLRSLDLSRNCLEGLDDALKSCKKLAVLNLSMNSLKQFPEVVTQLIALEELYLNDTSLELVPANVGRLIRLRILELRDNKLNFLPRALARFSQLVRLDIGQNDFTYLPDVVFELEKLQELWLDLNGLLKTSSLIGKFKNLNHLDMSENCLKSLPEEISECQQITELTLTSNDLTCLPVSIGCLTRLVTLKLDTNELSNLPDSIGDLINLEELNVSTNRLTSLPYSIGFLRKLVCLCLDYNKLEHLPPEIGSCTNLRVLTVQNNALESLVAEIGHLQNLAVLSLTNNRLRNLPMSVLKLRNLKALWLVYNQSKPLTPLVKEYDPHVSKMMLTCYLLPQVTPDYLEDMNIDRVSLSEPNERATNKKIRFSVNPIMEREGVLSRAPTPYPKKLRELAKSAKAIFTQQSSHKPTKHNGELPVVEVRNNVMVDQVKTAVVKKQAPSISTESPSIASQLSQPEAGDRQRPLPNPPPYHIAAAYSKQAPFFQKENTTLREERERRTDIDTEALSTLKDELLHHLHPSECRRSQSEQSGSVSEPLYIAMSDVDSAFVENPPPQQDINGTYSACLGIVITDNSSEEQNTFSNSDYHPYDSSKNHFSKVNNWLSSKSKSPITSESTSGYYINMYPCENSESFKNESNLNDQRSIPGLEKQEELITSSKITKPSKLPWLFGVHKNPEVIEVLVNKIGPDLGFCVVVLGSGVYISKVSTQLSASLQLKEGDKILQMEGTDITPTNIGLILNSLSKSPGPFLMMISRQ